MRGWEYRTGLGGGRVGVHQLLTQNRLAAHLHLAEGYVSRAYCIKPIEFYLETRGPAHIAEARQLVMYLAHVEFGIRVSDIARRYGRDRSTVAHAFKSIEDRRDDVGFDMMVGQIANLISLRQDPLFSDWRRVAS
ncbi:DNA replication initiation ATPase [Roseibium denhamense]|nr:DNA replication initiation ATPase [Roseibium denhamense]